MTNTQETNDMTTTTTVTLPMAGHKETITIENLPTDWVSILTYLADAGIFSYGPNYSRQSTENLRDMTRMLGFGDTEAAGHWFDRITRRHDEMIEAAGSTTGSHSKPTNDAQETNDMTTECECSEEYGPCEQHGTVLAQYDGAAVRTADELTYIYVQECFAILESELTPVAADVLRRVDEDWAAQENTYGVNWISDPDLADELRDLAWQLESTIDAWTFWDDGFVIVEPTDDCPLN